MIQRADGVNCYVETEIALDMFFDVRNRPMQISFRKQVQLCLAGPGPEYQLYRAVAACQYPLHLRSLLHRISKSARSQEDGERLCRTTFC